MNVLLNSDQQAALEAVQHGQNIFLTGPAGSGKSTLVAAIVDWAKRVGKVCDVTAMTGCAALLLGNKAKTLHSWAGIGLGRGTAEQLATDILKSPFSKKRWKRAHILVVDEISMMSPDLFEKLSQVGKRVRGGTAPWGNLQLILCGDFFQLPPVSKEVTTGRFAFDAPAWKAANLQPVVLSRIERQTDAAFQTLLNEARVGNLGPTSIATLKARQGLNWKENRIRPTLLFSRNADVDSINDANLTALQKPVHTFDAETVLEATKDPTDMPEGDFLTRLVQRMDADSSYVPHLELCEGAQVMLVFNMDMAKGLVNGSRGVIVGFRDGTPIVQFLHGDPTLIPHNEWVSNDCPALKRRQIPLRVAYAVTIHKSQGATLDCALVDIGSSTFECGQAYVALSRVRDLESLYVWNFNPAKVMADPKVVAFYASLLPTETTVPIHEMPPAPPPTPATSAAPTPAQSPCVSHTASLETETMDYIGTIAMETTPVPVEEDLAHVTRVEVPKAKKPRAPRKKGVLEVQDVAVPEAKKTKATRKEGVLEVQDVAAEAEAAAAPAEPAAKKPKAPRKKKEGVLEVQDVAAEAEPAEPAAKKPKAPRKKTTTVLESEAAPKKPRKRKELNQSIVSHTEIVYT